MVFVKEKKLIDFFKKVIKYSYFCSLIPKKIQKLFVKWSVDILDIFEDFVREGF